MYANGDYKSPVEYSGVDAPKALYQNLKNDAMHIKREFYNKKKPIEPLTCYGQSYVD